MVFDPTAKFLEPLDWETGMPHRAAEREQRARLPGFSDWAKNMLRAHELCCVWTLRFFLNPTGVFLFLDPHSETT